MNEFRITLQSFPLSVKHSYIRGLGTRTFLLPHATIHGEKLIESEYILFPGHYCVVNYTSKERGVLREAFYVAIAEDGKIKKFRNKGELIFHWLNVDPRRISISGNKTRRANASRRVNEFFFKLADKWYYMPSCQLFLREIFELIAKVNVWDANAIGRIIKNPEQHDGLSRLLTKMNERMLSELRKSENTFF